MSDVIKSILTASILPVALIAWTLGYPIPPLTISLAAISLFTVVWLLAMTIQGLRHETRRLAILNLEPERMPLQQERDLVANRFAAVIRDY